MQTDEKIIGLYLPCHATDPSLSTRKDHNLSSRKKLPVNNKLHENIKCLTKRTNQKAKGQRKEK